MAKALDITPEIEARIRKATGDEDFDTSNLAVYEVRGLSTKPISQRHTIFNGARATKGMLVEMARGLNEGDFSVPLQVMHETDLLPVGKAFYAGVIDRQDGDSELRVQIYLPKDTAAELIAKIESSTVDEVSVGAQAKALLCSECGFDFMSEEARAAGSLWTREDPKGHVVGEDGVHLILSGLDRWFEISLVNTGAARDPKILSRAKAALKASDHERIAASGVPLEATLFTASTSQEDPSMSDINALVTQLTTLSGSEAVAKAALKTAEGEVERLTAALTAETAKVTTLEAAAKEAPGAEVAVKLAAAEALLQTVLQFLAPEAKKALVASGTADAKEPDTIEAAITSLKASAGNLVNTLVIGGVAEGDGKAPLAKPVAKDYSAFTINAKR